ncbi:MAG: acyltransferase [Colwellia sp.]
MDILRALSAQLVVFGHAMVFSKVYLFERMPFPPVESIAVVVFFILSGFLISVSVINQKYKNESYSFYEFFVARFARIFVVLIPALVFVAVVDFTIISFDYDYNYNYSFNFKTAFSNLFMLQKNPISQTAMFGSASTWWSLSIEWWLYLFFGWFVLSFSKSINFWLVALLLGVFPLYYSVTGHGAGLPLVWFASALSVYFISADTKLNRLVGVAIVCGVLACIRFSSSNDAFDLVACVLLLVTFFCTFKLLNRVDSVPNVSFSRAVKFLAGYSYTLYLIHFTVMEALNSIYGQGHYFWGAIILSNLVALLFAYFTEMNLARIKIFIKKIYLRVQDGFSYR